MPRSTRMSFVHSLGHVGAAWLQRREAQAFPPSRRLRPPKACEATWCRQWWLSSTMSHSKPNCRQWCHLKLNALGQPQKRCESCVIGEEKLFSSLVALGILGLVFMREHIDRIHTQVESTQRKKSKKISEGTRGYPNFIPAIGGSAKGGGSVPQVPRQLRAKFPKSTSGSWDQ